MPGPPTMSPHRTKGSWTPRLAGVAVVVVLAGGALGVYLGTSHASHQVAHVHRQPQAPPVKVVSVQTVGVIDFGPDDNGDPVLNGRDDHPLMLQKQGNAVAFVPIPRKEISSGTPQWTANQMSDGTQIFIYLPTGQCLSAAGAAGLRLAHCDLGAAQRWRTLHAGVVLGQAIAQYANVSTGGCLTAPRHPGAAALTLCGKPRTRTQEIALWWSA
jgi:hypothetical protein